MRILVYILVAGVIGLLIFSYFKETEIEYVPKSPQVVDEGINQIVYACLDEEGIEIECKG